MKNKYIFFSILSLFCILIQCPGPFEYNLTIIIIPEQAGYVASNPDKYTPGTSVTLTAYNNDGFLFDYWEINNRYIVTENPFTFSIERDTIIKALFITIDIEAPVITVFEGPSSTTEPEITITLKGTDNFYITGWMITESPEQPLPQSTKWETLKPETYIFAHDGIINLYAWAKDAAENISDSKMITVEVIDIQAPVILEFSGPSLTNTLEIPLTLDGIDNFDTIFWIVRESSLIPGVFDPDWTGDKPSHYTVSAPGIYTLYAWAKDRAGNISESKTFTVTYDGVIPVITQFEYSGSGSTSSYTIPVILDGWDYNGITHWAITQIPFQPRPDSPAWVSNKPETWYLQYHGKNILYAWARDEAGNVSESVSITVEKHFKGSWTIMIWMDADNEHEHYGMKDINELEYGLFLATLGDSDIEDHLSIVVQADRIPGYNDNSFDNGPDWHNTRRYLIKPHAESYFLGDFESQLLIDMAEVNMGDVSEMKSFIEYSKTNFPADHFCLILWNSGNGIRSAGNRSNQQGQTKAVCIDNTNNNDMLFIGEIKQGLSDSEDVDVLGFDAGFMGTIEIAYEFRPDPAIVDFDADYMAASPSATYHEGWEYYRIIERFSGSAVIDSEGDECYDIETLAPAVLTACIVKENQDAYLNIRSQTITGLNLQTIGNVKEAIDTLVIEITENKHEAEIVRGESASVSLLHYFNESIVDEWIAVPHFDLYDFAEQISMDPLFSENAHDASTALMGILEISIVKSWAGLDYPGHSSGKHGLAFFFPDGDRSYGPGDTDVHYKLQYWYTNLDLSVENQHYGNIDFCATIPGNERVETWKELLEYWFDYENTLTMDEW